MSRLILLSLNLALASSSAAGFDASAWKWRKAFAAPAAGQARVTLDAEVFGASREDLADLRVTGPDGAETPYVLEVEKEGVRDACVKARLYNLSRTASGDTRFELDLGAGAGPHNYLFLDIAPESRDFRVMVKLEGSRDAKEWAVLKEGGSILDFSESFRVRYSELYYPESDFRYLRLTLSDRDSPVKVAGASVRRHSHRPGLENEPAFTVAKGSSAASVIWELDFGHDFVPVRRLVFQAAGKDFKRRATVSVPTERYREEVPPPRSWERPTADGKDWRQAGEGALYRYRTARFRGESLELKFTEVRARLLRAEVFHYDDKPIALEGVRAYGFTRRLRLKDLAPGDYTLHYGNPLAQAPRYDLADLAGYLDDQGLPELRLSPQQAAPGYVPARGPWTEERPWLLWTALGASLLMLAGLVVRQWRRV